MNYYSFNYLTNDSGTHPIVIISLRKEIMFWVSYLPTLWHIVIKFTFFFGRLPLDFISSFFCQISLTTWAGYWQQMLILFRRLSCFGRRENSRNIWSLAVWYVCFDMTIFIWPLWVELLSSWTFTNRIPAHRYWYSSGDSIFTK